MRCALLALAGILFVLAPAAPAQDVRAGLRLGRTSSTFGGGEAHFFITSNHFRHGVFERASGIEGMGFLRLPVVASVGLQWEFGYGRRGARQILANGARRDELEYQFGYAQTALLLRVAAVDGPRFGLGAHIGPYAGYMTSNSVAFEQMRFDGEVNAGTADDLETLRDIDAGLILGADVTLSRWFVLDARFSFGFSDFVDADRLNSFARSQHSALRNTSFVLSAGIAI
ncbi:MAG: porin family protein [Rhodothermales bacterium]